MVAAVLPDRLRKQLEALPARPGVYLMRNEKGAVIYVGKAARLKDRVRSYFGSPRSLEPKTRALRAEIEDFEYIVCATRARHSSLRRPSSSATSPSSTSG